MVAFPTWSQTININRPIEQDEAMTKYLDLIKEFEAHKSALGASWTGINPEYAARMRLQNRFKTGLDIARYTASIMRADMAAYDNQLGKLHPIAWLLAWFYRPTNADGH